MLTPGVLAMRRPYLWTHAPIFTDRPQVLLRLYGFLRRALGVLGQTRIAVGSTGFGEGPPAVLAARSKGSPLFETVRAHPVPLCQWRAQADGRPLGYWKHSSGWRLYMRKRPGGMLSDRPKQFPPSRGALREC